MSTSEPSWDLYGAFLAVMQHGSLSGASRALRVAQPTVRRQIEALEEQLGVALFTRAPNGLTPTDLARATVPHAEAIAASARAFVRAVSAPAEREAGTVRVTASEVVGAEVLPAILARLLADKPALSIELVLDDRNQDLLRREADVAVRMVAPTQTGLVQRRAARIELGLFASEGYVARRGVPATVSALRDHALVGPDRQRAAIEALARGGLELAPRDFALRTDSTLAQLAAVRAGVGIGIAQAPLARAPLPLVRVLPKLAFWLEAWVVTHEDLRGVARVRAVVDHLVTELGVYASPPTKRTTGPARPTARAATSLRGGTRARRVTGR
jgi:DNA-binding transcriptional LysR family regulator